MVRLVKEWQDHSVSGWYGLTMDSGKIVNIWGRFRPPNHPQVYIYHESNAKSDHLLKVHFQIHLTFLLLRNVWLSSFLNHLIHFAFFADFTIEAFALCAFPYSINCIREICPFVPIFQGNNYFRVKYLESTFTFNIYLGTSWKQATAAKESI